jgi:ethanolamine ammonia-lyase small subunit
MDDLRPDILKHIPQADPWSSLRSFTSARIALGRTGVALPLKESLNLALAHAHARDAVYSMLHIDELTNKLSQFSLPIVQLHSNAKDRKVYLQRPDMGRKLELMSLLHLQEFATPKNTIAISITDGLSANAINENIVPLLVELMPMLRNIGVVIAPLCLISQGRVAISDEVGAGLKANLSLIFIGERPGLSSQDSMGAYLTYNPSQGLTDESRNCVSNIRPDGLSYIKAAQKIFYLVQESLRLKISGVLLKDNNNSQLSY